jgi:hypothetical protein
MKTLKDFTFIIFFSLLTINSFSQDKKEEIDLTNKFALQFQILRNFELSGFGGAAISGKYCFNNSSSIRASFSINQSTNKREDETIPKDTSLNGTGSFNFNDIDLLKFGFGIQYLHNIRILNNVIYYLGGGPYLASSSENHDTEEKFQYGPEIYKSNQETTYFEFGVNLVTGVEWFVANNISLSGEYELYYFNRDYEFIVDGDYGKRTITETNSGFDYGAVKLGVTVYF